MRDDPVEKLRADAATPVLGEDAHDYRGALGRLRGAAEPEAYGLVAFERNEVKALRLPLQPALDGLQLVRFARRDRVPDLTPGREVGVSLRAPDHPDRFSLPCRFA